MGEISELIKKFRPVKYYQTYQVCAYLENGERDWFCPYRQKQGPDQEGLLIAFMEDAGEKVALIIDNDLKIDKVPLNQVTFLEKPEEEKNY